MKICGVVIGTLTLIRAVKHINDSKMELQMNPAELQFVSFYLIKAIINLDRNFIESFSVNLKQLGVIII